MDLAKCQIMRLILISSLTGTHERHPYVVGRNNPANQAHGTSLPHLLKEKAGFMYHYWITRWVQFLLYVASLCSTVSTDSIIHAVVRAHNIENSVTATVSYHTTHLSAHCSWRDSLLFFQRVHDRVSNYGRHGGRVNTTKNIRT